MLESEPPRCPCHDVSMYWAAMRDGRRGGGVWRCREKRKEHDRKRWRAYYDERIPFVVRARKDMTSRRCAALKRRRERQLRREHGSL